MDIERAIPSKSWDKVDDSEDEISSHETVGKTLLNEETVKMDAWSIEASNKNIG